MQVVTDDLGPREQGPLHGVLADIAGRGHLAVWAGFEPVFEIGLIGVVGVIGDAPHVAGASMGPVGWFWSVSGQALNGVSSLGQPWRALNRRLFLLMTNVRPRRRTTCEPDSDFSDRSELRTFTVGSFWVSARPGSPAGCGGPWTPRRGSEPKWSGGGVRIGDRDGLRR